MNQERNIWIDFIRSIAIIIMIIANSAAVIGNKEYSYFFRIICSLAAPLFVLLSGISFSVSSKYQSTSHTKTRSALYLLITASCIDLFIWQSPPFYTFDVLYIIAFGIFLNIFLNHKTLVYFLSFILLSIGLAVYLQVVLPYRFEMQEISLQNIVDMNIRDYIMSSIRYMFVDGWFPIFPWICLPIIGTLIVKYQSIYQSNKLYVYMFSLFALLVSIYGLITASSIVPLRNGYVELFYPASYLIFILVCSGALLFFTNTFHNKTSNTFINYFSMIGKYSLFIYIIHIAIIHFVLDVFFNSLDASSFAVVMVIFTVSLYVIIAMLELTKARHIIQRLPFSISKIIGL
ncbi:MAG: acyltransferase family protein [Bacteroidota bacterium]